MGRPYMVGTGWWCDGSGEHAGSLQPDMHSSSLIRQRDFFRLWHAFVDRYLAPERIVIVDSASPVPPPDMGDPRIQRIVMTKNFGHGIVSEPMGSMSGVERCLLTLAMHAYTNDLDLVYVEQDCLVRGEGWLELALEAMRGGKAIYGRGKGTPQPMQQSLMIFRCEYLPTVIARVVQAWRRFQRGRPWDPLAYRRLGNSIEKRWHWAMRRDADYLPFGSGRVRPLDFTQLHLYAQHWSEEELRRLLAQESWVGKELEVLLGSSG